MLEVIKESRFLIIAIVVGIFCFKKLDGFLKVLLLLVLFGILTYIASYIRCPCSHCPNCNNQIIFNAYIVIETILIGYAGSKLLPKNSVNYLIVGFIIFWSFYIYHLALLDFATWEPELLTFEDKRLTIFATKAQSTASVYIVIICLWIIFQFIANSGLRKPPPQFPAIIGLLIYFGCNAPYWGVLAQVQNYSEDLNRELFSKLTVGLSHIRYLLLTLSLILAYRSQKKISVSM